MLPNGDYELYTYVIKESRLVCELPLHELGYVRIPTCLYSEVRNDVVSMESLSCNLSRTRLLVLLCLLGGSPLVPTVVIAPR